MLRVLHAILHAFDFEVGSAYLSQAELSLDDRQTKSYVQRHLRRITASPESRHGEFADDSLFAGQLVDYLSGRDGFVELSISVAQWFWEENVGAKKPVIKTGAEIPFTRYFYKYQQPTPSEELEARFNALEASLSARIAKLFGGEQ